MLLSWIADESLYIVFIMLLTLERLMMGILLYSVEETLDMVRHCVVFVEITVHSVKCCDVIALTAFDIDKINE